MLTRLLVAALLTGSVWGYDFSALKPEGCVSDFARVVNNATKLDLERYCAEVEKTAGVQLALVTLRSLEREPIDDVAQLLYRKWAVGHGKANGGVLLLLAIRERQGRLEVAGGLQPVLPAGALLDEMRPALSERHFGDALILAARGIGARLEQHTGRKTALAPSTRRVTESSSRWGVFAVALLAGGAVALILFAIARRGADKAVADGGWRDANGGFGGYDSGDSFGGFGGEPPGISEKR